MSVYEWREIKRVNTDGRSGACDLRTEALPVLLRPERHVSRLRCPTMVLAAEHR
jgi:hypothetical protein